MLPSEYLKKGWTREFSAITLYGAITEPTSPNATKWCMEGARLAAYANNNINYEIQSQLRRTIIELIREKINSNKNIIRRFLNNRKYNKTNPITHWNDNDCKNQEEAIELMQEAEKIIGLTPEKMISLQTRIIDNIVNVQIEEILNDDTISYMREVQNICDAPIFSLSPCVGLRRR